MSIAKEYAAASAEMMARITGIQGGALAITVAAAPDERKNETPTIICLRIGNVTQAPRNTANAPQPQPFLAMHNQFG